MGRKLTLIGGGSVRTYYFIESLMKFYQEMDIGEVAVMDNDGEKLRYFGGIAKYLAEKEKSGLNVTLTTDAREALRDADYVVTTVRVGQDKARTVDERTALNLGVIGQETTGAGGFSYAIRTIPTMIGYMELIREVAKPDAPVFNFTNPSGLVTQALYDAGFDNIIGICDNATGIKIDVANALQVNASDLMVKVYGLNHLSWANRVEINGVDILPRLMENDSFVQSFHQFAYFNRDLVRRLGEIPNGYLYYFYHRERALKNLLAAPESRGEFILRNNAEMMEELRRHDIQTEPQVCLDVYRDYMHRREGSYMQIELGGEGVHVPPIDVESLGIRELLGNKPVTEIYEGYAGVVFNYIDSVKNNKGIDLAVSVPNKGAIPGMAEDDVVEITCTIDRRGAVPMKFTEEEVKPSNLALMKTIKRYEKLTVEAVRTKSRAAAIEALTIHPLVQDYDLAVKLVDSYCKANEPWIGKWS
ncbi:MAG: 6-phospho-beta-glucosidase [Faecousia sp.]